MPLHRVKTPLKLLFLTTLFLLSGFTAFAIDVKALICRKAGFIRGEMPLSYKAGLVAAGLEGFGKREFLQLHELPRLLLAADKIVREPRARREFPGHDGGA